MPLAPEIESSGNKELDMITSEIKELQMYVIFKFFFCFSEVFFRKCAQIQFEHFEDFPIQYEILLQIIFLPLSCECNGIQPII